MEAILYAMSKRKNSTKRVDFEDINSNWICLDVELKESTSIFEPVFQIHLEPGNPEDPLYTICPSNIKGVDKSGAVLPLPFYNHVYVSSLHPVCQYFKVKDIIIDNTIAIVYTETDFLQSYRYTILNSTQFIGRISSPKRCDRSKTDLVPVSTNDYTTSCSYAANVFIDNYDEGSYVVGVINGSPTVGSVCYYLFRSINEIYELFDYLFSETFFTPITDIGVELAKSLINPLQYIVSCKYFPLKLDYLEANGVPMKVDVDVGCWKTPVKAYRMQDLSTTVIGAIPAALHPQRRNDYNDYLLSAPYTECVFHLEPFGSIPVDPGKLKGANAHLAYRINVDHVSGKAKLYLYNERSTDEYIGVYYADIAQDIQLSQTVKDYLGIVESVASTVGSTIGNVLSLNIGGAISDAYSHGLDSFRAALPQLRTSGGGAYVPFIDGMAKLYVKHTMIDTAYHDRYGYLCGRNLKISDCSGDWLQCPKPELSLNCPEYGVEKIYDVMREGIWIE